MNFALSSSGLSGSMSFDAASGLGNNVYLSLMVPQGAFFLDRTFGLRARPGLKLTEESAALRKGDIEEALKWILEAGKATKITVAVSPVETALYKRLEAMIEVYEANGGRETFTYYQEVI